MITLHHGDCLEVMKSIPDKSIDLVLTDPPYGTTACKWDVVIPFEPMWEQLKRITKDNGAICLFGIEPFSSSLRLSNIKSFRYDWFWIKNYNSGFVMAKKRPLVKVETISVFYNKQCRYNPIFESYSESSIKRFSKNRVVNNSKEIKQGYITNKNGIKPFKGAFDFERGKYPSNVINFKCVAKRSKEKSGHPTQKPLALLEYLIKTYTLEGETVLDFTMGSGSTGVACKNLNRSFIGIEKDNKYFNIAKERIENHVPSLLF